MAERMRMYYRKAHPGLQHMAQLAAEGDNEIVVLVAY